MTVHVEAGEVPGLVTLVARGDDVHIDVIGSPSFADDTPLARSAIFRIASLTKPITSLTVPRVFARVFCDAGTAWLSRLAGSSLLAHTSQTSVRKLGDLMEDAWATLR